MLFGMMILFLLLPGTKTSCAKRRRPIKPEKWLEGYALIDETTLHPPQLRTQCNHGIRKRLYRRRTCAPDLCAGGLGVVRDLQVPPWTLCPCRCKGGPATAGRAVRHGAQVQRLALTKQNLCVLTSLRETKPGRHART